MKVPPLNTTEKRYDRALSKGALVNAVGLVAKIAQPALLLVVTWWFGPEITGLYLLASLVGDVIAAATVAGYADALVVWGSRALRDHGPVAMNENASAEFYEAAGTAFRAALLISLLLGIGMWFAASALNDIAFGSRPGLSEALRYVAASALPLALGRLGTAATKAKFHMHYDVFLWGFGRPLLLVLTAWVASLYRPDVGGLMQGYFVAHCIAGVCGLWAFAQYFSLARLTAALFKRSTIAGLHSFSLAQNANMTLNRYGSRLDVIMLSMLGQPAALIAFYGTAALITSSLQEIRLIFSSALAPIVARYHREDDRSGMEVTLGRVSRWTTTLFIPAALVVLLTRNDLLQCFDKSYTGDSSFMLALLAVPLLSCAIGLAGNFLVFTGHTAFNFLNSGCSAVFNTALSFLLIPEYGLMGSACSTAITASLVGIAQLIELRALEGVHYRFCYVRSAYLAGVPLVLLAVVIDVLLPQRTLLMSCALVLACLVFYTAALFAARNEELLALLRKIGRRNEPSTT